uniref:Uncharacterized protein n=1 Tax=Avena sativa TaxID=4498 RepID=A0ACD5X838_AVESA
MELEARKLYVGGLPPSTQQEELKEHFGRYGEVLCVRVVRNPDTGLGRGFAFVEFADDEGPRAALDEKEKDSHVFGGRTVDVKRARIRPMRYPTEQPLYWYYANQSPVHSQLYNQSSSNNSSAGYGYRGSDPYKVFVGGLRGHVTKEELTDYFEKFGTITDVVVIREGLTQKPRGFGFITFDSEEAMRKVLETTFHDLNGTKVETKMAIPKDHSYNFDRRQHSPVWRGSNYPIGYGGVYPPHNMPYIINNNYMIPFQQYMYSPHTFGDYGYMENGSSHPNEAGRQGSPIFAGYGTHFGHDYSGINRFGLHNRSDSKVNQVIVDKQSLQESLNSELKDIP